ncbi:uncharacterized protein LOC118755535 [Rhagoletis pomonella]|uniref:uncharacterized protein LOC118755535 n=1 Tax=Rhagoletis pomonella TaxID=28610 RepID=UPI001782A0F7|nr:uncharacterized protein LOC118755535 [Rhagoletis pomonella]
MTSHIQIHLFNKTLKMHVVRKHKRVKGAKPSDQEALDTPSNEETTHLEKRLMDNPQSSSSKSFQNFFATLKFLLRDKIVFKLFSNKKVSNVNCYSDYNDGLIYKQKEFFNENLNRIELLLFQDAFENCNPLASSKKKHKLLGVYMMIGNIPKEFRSNIHNIQLVLLCKDTYIKLFGFEKIMAPLICDLRKLEENGIDFLLDGSNQNYRGTLFSMLGDNLGSLQIGGYTENFSSSKFMSRYCLFKRENLIYFNVDIGEKRTRQNYEACLNNLSNPPDFGMGIKKDSCLNELGYFHVCEGLPPCISHDLFEGIIPYDLMEVCKYMCIQDVISIDYINMSLSSLRKKFKLKLSFPHVNLNMKKTPGKADEILHFLVIFPFIFFNKSSINKDPVWKFLTVMIEMCRLINSSELDENQISLLSHCITVYMEYRRECFPLSKLWPKHHYICHI